MRERSDTYLTHVSRLLWSVENLEKMEREKKQELVLLLSPLSSHYFISLSGFPFVLIIRVDLCMQNELPCMYLNMY